MNTCCLVARKSRGQSHLSLAIVALLASASSSGFAERRNQGAPDLIINRTRIVNTVEVQYKSFSASACAVVEKCVRGVGLRTLLLFDAAIANVGNGDLVVGSPVDNPLFEFSPCHGHYHFRGLATYQLFTSAGSAVLSGRKQSFCITDTVPYTTSAPRTSGFNCDNQGLTRGWEDVYSKGLDCQWLDITGVLPGQYQLRVGVNLERTLVESDYQNNTVSVPIRIYRIGRSLKVGPAFSYTSGRSR